MPVGVANDEAGVSFLSSPRRREAARGGHGVTIGTDLGGIANYRPRAVRSAMNDRMKSSAVSGAELKPTSRSISVHRSTSRRPSCTPPSSE